MLQVRDGTRLEQLEFGVNITVDKIILGRNKNRWAADICVLNRMRLRGLGDGVKINSDCSLGYDAVCTGGNVLDVSVLCTACNLLLYSKP
jgi:hypothetical protein